MTDENESQVIDLVRKLLAAPLYGNGDEYDDPEGTNREFWEALAALRDLVGPR